MRFWGFWGSDDDGTKISSYGQNGWSTWGSFNQSTLPKYSSWRGSGTPWGMYYSRNIQDTSVRLELQCMLTNRLPLGR